ncbi:MAG: hypothetical protein GKR88_17790 [Flavobacteriaceae bacterium]|nr:MAG: hypothetical protein GKR88_17790 [Flavobacteriaceae bacterium]
MLPFFSARHGKEQLTVPELYTKAWLPYVDSQLTREILTKEDIACPPVNSHLMKTYFDVLIKQGFIDKPRKKYSKTK